MTPTRRTPRLVRFLIERLVPADQREFFLGDLEEGNRRTWLREILAAAALPVVWYLRSMLLDVSPFDPIVFGTVLGVLLCAGWLGCLGPVLKATRVDPQTALGAE